MEMSKKEVQGITPEYLEKKALYFESHKKLRQRKRWYKKHNKVIWFKFRLRRTIKRLCGLHIPFKIPSTIRWVIVDFLRAKPRKFWGIYQFVALPGEGKTLSMVAHMERVRKELGPDRVIIATNFYYANQDIPINHWSDMIAAAKKAQKLKKACILAIDEIHTTFDASDWKSFPPEMLALLSFNRKYSTQFICSSQIYDRIPKKVRDISNYTILCKNTLGLDRHFTNFYYNTLNYEEKFSGKRNKADYIRTFVADDYLYSLYDTLAQVDKMTADAQKETDKKKEAFDLLFGHQEEEEEPARIERA